VTVIDTASITGKVFLGSNITARLLSPSRVMIVDAANNLSNAIVTIVELNRLSGLDSPIVTQTILSSSNYTYGIQMANSILTSLLQTTNPAVIKTISAGANFTITDQGTNLLLAASAGAAGDSILVDAANTVDPNFDDGGSINFQYSAGTITAYIKSGVVNNTNLADMTANTFKMRATGTGAPIDGTPAQALTALESGGVNILVSTEVDTASEWETILGGLNVIFGTEIDSISELETLTGVDIIVSTELTASQTPLAQDVNAANFSITNLAQIQLNNALSRGITNLSGVAPKLVLNGPGVVFWTPTNETILDIVPLNSTNATYALVSITQTGAVHNQTISNALAFRNLPLVMLPDGENLFLVWWDPNAQTNKIFSYQTLTNTYTGDGSEVRSNAPTINVPTLLIPVIASFASATHTHQNAAGGGTLDAAAIAAGTLGSARLGSGTADDNAFLRGDSTWGRSTTDGQTLRLAAGVLGFGALDLADVDAVTGSLPDGNIPNNITIDLATLATTATTANAGDSATAFFSSGTIEDARLPTTLDGKNFTTSTATTPSAGDNDTSLATTAYVQTAITNIYDYVWVSAGAMTPASVNGPGTNVFNPSGEGDTIDVFDFDDTTSETNFFTWAPPENWDLGTFKIKVHWTATTGTASQGVTWGTAAGAISNDDAHGTILGTRQTTTDSYIVSGDHHIGPASSAITAGGTPALGDMLLIAISRVPADGSDTKTGDAKLIGLMIQYQKSTLNSAAW